MKYLIVIEKGHTNYGAYVPDLPGCVAVGDTQEIVTERIRGAIEAHIQLMREHGEDVPSPTSSPIEMEVA